MVKLDGPWKEGYAFDIHTIKSEYTGNNESGYATFNTIRSPMGQCIYELKYGQHLPVLEQIKKMLLESTDLKKFIEKIDIIIPVPPSNKFRKIQPVKVCATALAEIYKKSINSNILASTNKDELKNIPAIEKYEKIKKGITITNTIEKTKNLMIFDDVFDSGSTLAAISNSLNEKGYYNIYIFTLSKTRKAD